MLFYLGALLITAADQFFKYLVNKNLPPGQSMPLIGNIIKLTYVKNTGAAFSLFVGFSPYLAIVGMAVILAAIYFHFRIPAKNYLAQIALAFILGGSLGNLIDRLFRAYVIDYLDITIWPVFNLADVMINLGVVLLIYNLFKKEGGKDVSNPV